MSSTSQKPPGRASTLRTFHAFQNRDFRILWPANFFSYISRWMQMTLLAWMVLQLTDSPLLVALVGFFGMGPMLLLGVFGGALADRLDRRRLLVTTQTVNCIAVLIMAVLLNTGLVQFWYAYVAIAVSGAGWALDSPSRRSIIHSLLGRSGVTNAIALDSVAMHGSRMMGPALAGVLINLVDVKGGYFMVVAFQLLAVALIWSVRVPPRPETDGSTGESKQNEGRDSQSIFRNLAEGFRYVRGSRIILATIAVTILMNLFVFSYIQIMPIIATDVLGVGSGLMGLLIAIDGFGALIGSTLIASMTGLRHHGRVYLGGSMIALFALLAFSFSRSYLLSLGILLVLGLGGAGFGTMQATIIMLVAREDMRGRALGVISLAIGAGPLGALLIGVVANTAGPMFAIGLNASIGIAALILVALLMPSLRQRTQTDEQRNIADS
ncbi:MAG: MFS transporter [Chloroflexi bacterium]|nr:MFS transporter [Chloroflexota bacterium]